MMGGRGHFGPPHHRRGRQHGFGHRGFGPPHRDMMGRHGGHRGFGPPPRGHRGPQAFDGRGSWDDGRRYPGAWGGYGYGRGW